MPGVWYRPHRIWGGQHGCGTRQWPLALHHQASQGDGWSWTEVLLPQGGRGFGQGADLTPIYMEASFLLSDAGLHGEDGNAIPIGVAAFAVSPGDNAVNLSASEGATSNLMLQCLLHLSADLIMIPPQLSLPGWTRMRRMKIGYKSFVCFSAAYLPPNTPESQCLSQQLMILKDLRVPDPQVLFNMADQLDSLRTVSPQLEGETRPGDKDDPKGETPKKSKQVGLEDGSEKKKPHRCHEDKNHLRHSSADKSPSLSLQGPKVGTI